MPILVVNSGSSSIKFSIFDGAGAEPRLMVDGELSGIGGAHASLEVRGGAGREQKQEVEAGSTAQAIGAVFAAVTGDGMPTLDAVGYRVVHPGPKLRDHQRITPEVMRELGEAVQFAPLHDPEAIVVIREGMGRFPEIAHYACFDTVFHQTMPAEATTYPVPEEYGQRGVRRYGFHGLSLESVVRQMTAGGEAMPRRTVIAHLGSGCSVTALVEERSIDTSMGLTPTGGVVMGTRPGDLDPGLVVYLLRQQDGDAKAAADALEGLLNHGSGMVALSRLANDMKAVRKAAEGGDARAVLALKVFTRSVRKAIGGYCWLMGGVDAIVFTGGIGEHDAATRAEVLADGDGLGVVLDEALNRSHGDGVRRIAGAASKVNVFAVPAQEDLMIALHVGTMEREKRQSTS